VSTRPNHRLQRRDRHSTAIFGQLQKFGTGTLILNGSHGYAFGTVVSQGTLISNTNLTSNGTILLVNSLISGLRIDAGAVARVFREAHRRRTRPARPSAH